MTTTTTFVPNTFNMLAYSTAENNQTAEITIPTTSATIASASYATIITDDGSTISTVAYGYHASATRYGRISYKFAMNLSTIPSISSVTVYMDAHMKNDALISCTFAVSLSTGWSNRQSIGLSDAAGWDYTEIFPVNTINSTGTLFFGLYANVAGGGGGTTSITLNFDAAQVDVLWTVPEGNSTVTTTFINKTNLRNWMSPYKNYTVTNKLKHNVTKSETFKVEYIRNNIVKNLSNVYNCLAYVSSLTAGFLNKLFIPTISVLDIYPENVHVVRPDDTLELMALWCDYNHLFFVGYYKGSFSLRNIITSETFGPYAGNMEFPELSNINYMRCTIPSSILTMGVYDVLAEVEKE